MESTKKNARIAGLFYVILVLTGLFSLMYVPSTLVVQNNPLKTYNNIVAQELLFKLGILGNLASSIAFIFLSFALYKLLHHIHKNMAIIMVALVLVSIPISFVNLISKLDIITLINQPGATNLNINEQPFQLMLLLKSYSNGLLIVQIFWGLWLFPFGWLVYKSGFLPKLFGILLMVGCFGYLTDFVGYFLFPNGYGKTIIPTIAAIPHAFGEIGISLWLLIVGARE